MGLNTAHELGHKHNRWEQWLARLALAVPAYGHFTVEHGRGHHRWVATPSDHASARMGESIYRFAWRELPGGERRASRRYQSLRDFPDLPRLPSGYFGMFTLAYFPALWFKVMDRRLLALPQIRGDLAKVNVAPRQRARLAARYPETAARN